MNHCTSRSWWYPMYVPGQTTQSSFRCTPTSRVVQFKTEPSCTDPVPMTLDTLSDDNDTHPFPACVVQFEKLFKKGEVQECSVVRQGSIIQVALSTHSAWACAATRITLYQHVHCHNTWKRTQIDTTDAGARTHAFGARWTNRNFMWVTS